MSDPRRVEIIFEGRPPLLNAERSAHWRKHRAKTALLRTEAHLRLLTEAREGEMGMVKVDVWSFYDDLRLPDTGACMPLVKAAIDGAVDAGLLPHDGPPVVRHVAFWAPRKTGANQTIVIFEEIGEDSPWHG